MVFGLGKKQKEEGEPFNEEEERTEKNL